MSQTDCVDVADPRLAHLASNQSLVIKPKDLVNHWPHLGGKLYPVADNMVRVYCYDGELDDQIRLENTLLQATKSAQLLIVAGQRIDGEDTLYEMTEVILRTLKTTVSSQGDVADWPNLKILLGGPLVAKTPEQELDSENAADRLASALRGRDFVFHNNTSATFLLTVLRKEELQHRIQAATFTCGTIAYGNKTELGANARWNKEAFLECIDICTGQAIPFVSVHGSLSGYPFANLPELDGWSDVMLQPLTSEKQKILFQKAVGFSAALVLTWLAAAFVRATKSNHKAILKVLDVWRGEDGLLHKASPTFFSKEWLAFVQGRLKPECFCERSLARVTSRLHAIAVNLDFPFSNTIGDVSGCAFDMPVGEDDLVILRASIHEDAEKWRGVVGEQQDKPSEHYILAYADQSATLSKAWQAVKKERLSNSRAEGYEPVDEDLKRGWHQFAILVEQLLEDIWNNRDQFPEESTEWLAKARQNLANGPWADHCKTAVSSQEGSCELPLSAE